jgi:tetratricopeptide (TPR) repeat protein
MQLATTILGVAVSALLLLQGSFCLRFSSRELRPFWLGIVTLILGGIGITLYPLLFTGVLVVSPEFGVILVEGMAGALLLRLLLVAGAAAAGIALHILRDSSNWPARLPWLLVAGLLTGLGSASLLDTHNPNDPPSLVVRSYDMWRPLLLIWLAVCLAGGLISVCRVRSTLRWAWGSAAIVCGIAIFALQRAQSHVFWQWCLRASLALAMGLAAWLWAPVRRSWLRLGVAAGVAALGWTGASAVTRMPLGLRPWALWVALVALAVLSLAGQPGWRNWKETDHSRAVLQWPPARYMILGLALVALALTVADVFQFATHDPGATFAALLAAWLLFAGQIGGGPLVSHMELLCTPQPWAAVFRRFRYTIGIGARAMVAFSLGPDPKALPVLLKAIAALLLLTVAAEIPNAGKTMIRPFKMNAAPDLKEKDLGYAVTDRLAVSLRQFSQDLRETTMVKDKTREVATGGSSASIEAQIAKSGDIAIGGFKVPVGMLLAPVLGPVRWLLRVRVIDGTLHVDQQSCSLVASSTWGEIWYVELPRATSADPTRELAERLALQIAHDDAAFAAAGMTRDWDAFSLFRQGLAEWKRYEMEPTSNRLALVMDAFRGAIGKDPQFVLAYYRLGLALQEDAQPEAAAEMFRATLRIRPDFVRAATALAFLGSNPDFFRRSPPAALLAQRPTGQRPRTQYGWRQVLHTPSGVTSVADRGAAYFGYCIESQEERGYYDANDDYQVADPDLKLAYYQCRRAESLYRELIADDPVDTHLKSTEASVLLALGGILANATPGRMEESTKWHCSPSTVDVVAVLKPCAVEPVGSVRKQDDCQAGRRGLLEKGWIGKRKIRRSLDNPRARSYYRRALELAPGDPNIRCALADLALTGGDDGPMIELANDAAVRSAVAEHFLEAATGYVGPPQDSADEARQKQQWAQAYYRLALTEFTNAIDRDPVSVDARIGFGNTFWRWRVNLPPDQSSSGPTAEDARMAAQHARDALRLVRGRPVNTDSLAVIEALLGDILVAQGLVSEGIRQLEEARSHATGNAQYDTLRWDLAQAYLCADPTDANGKARELLNNLRQRDQEREDPMFQKPGALGTGRAGIAGVQRRPAAVGHRPGKSTDAHAESLADVAIVRGRFCAPGRPCGGAALETKPERIVGNRELTHMSV